MSPAGNTSTYPSNGPRMQLRKSAKAMSVIESNLKLSRISKSVQKSKSKSKFKSRRNPKPPRPPAAGPRKEVLFLCFMSPHHLDKPLGYAILSLQVSSLLDEAHSSLNDQIQIRHVYSWSGYNVYPNSGWINLKSGLYIVGGRHRAGYDERLHGYSLRCMSSDFSHVDISAAARDQSNSQGLIDIYSGYAVLPVSSSAVFYGPSPLPNMYAGKGAPILVNIHGKLYALTTIPLIDEPGPKFEAYDPVLKRWLPLEPPPFFVRSSKYCLSLRFPVFSYVVMEDKLCVSPGCGPAFTYDISTNRWSICELFVGFDTGSDAFDTKSHDSDSDSDSHASHDDLDDDDDDNDDDDLMRDSVFRFSGRAIFYDGDTLIGLNFKLEAVVAFHIENGKVVRMQVLDKLTFDHNGCYYDLVYLGRSYFCLVCQTIGVSFVTFKVSKMSTVVGDGPVSTFLDYKILSTRAAKFGRDNTLQFSFAR